MKKINFLFVLFKFISIKDLYKVFKSLNKLQKHNLSVNFSIRLNQTWNIHLYMIVVLIFKTNSVWLDNKDVTFLLYSDTENIKPRTNTRKFMLQIMPNSFFIFNKYMFWYFWLTDCLLWNLKWFLVQLWELISTFSEA